MKRPFNKKRFWMVIAILVVIEAAGLCLAMRWKYISPSNEVSEIYKHYQNVQGVDASFIKDFKINDSVFVDVTMLEAKDSAGWNTLCKKFNILKPPHDLLNIIDNGKDQIVTRLINRNNYLQRHCDSSTDVEVLAISYLETSICIFHVTNETEEYAVIHHNLTKSYKK